MSSSSNTRSRIFACRSRPPNFWITRAIWLPTEWLGFSVSNGFWNTICMYPTVLPRALSTGICAMSWPLRRTSPSVAVSSPIITLAKVDLPQPDSPTMATVSPRRASKSSCSLALTVPHALAGEHRHQRAVDHLVVFLHPLDLEHLTGPIGSLRLAAGRAWRRSRSRASACSARHAPRLRHPRSPSSGCPPRRSAPPGRSRSAGRSSSPAGAGAAAAAGRGSASAAPRSCRRRAAGSSRTGRAYRGAQPRRRLPHRPASTASPEYMTVIRSQVSRIRPRLWEM